jgi:uncharacterized ubiquitin-like protein YukD
MTVFAAFFIFAMIVAVVSAMPPISVVASIKGKKYDIADVDTVEEFIEKAEGLAGIEAGQSSVLFRGKVLTVTDRLEDIGVAAGDVLMVVKGRKQRAVKPDSADGESMGGAVSAGFEDSMDMNSDAYKEAMKNANPEDIQKAMKAMDNLLDSNFVDDYFSDDERLENARLQMLANVDQYENQMPGFKEQALAIAQDPVKWREAMLQAKEQISKLKEQRDAMRSAKGESPAASTESNRYP